VALPLRAPRVHFYGVHLMPPRLAVDVQRVPPPLVSVDLQVAALYVQLMPARLRRAGSHFQPNPLMQRRPDPTPDATSRAQWDTIPDA